MNKYIKKIFSHLHIFDILIILIIGATLIFYLTHFNRTDNEIIVDIFTPASQWTTFPFQPQPRWQTESIEAGNDIYNATGNRVAQVIEVGRLPWNSGSQEFIYVSLKLQATYNPQTKTYIYEGSPLLVGNQLKIDSPKANLQGQIIGIFQNEQDKVSQMVHKKATITVRYHLQDPWVAETMVHPSFAKEYQDSLQIISAKIIPAETAQPNAQGQLVRTTNPLKRDIILTLDLNDVTCSRFTCFFNHFAPLSIGGPFYMDFATISPNVDNSITDIQYHDN